MKGDRAERGRAWAALVMAIAGPIAVVVVDRAGIAPVFAADEAAPAGEEGGPPPAEKSGPPVRITVTAPRPAQEAESLDRRDLESGRAPNLAVAFAEIPGVWGVRRAQNSLEPVIRGLGWERVQTQVNGLPVFGACAARMDPPATLLQPEAARDAAVVKGLGSVTLGPGGTGGRLIVSTDPGQPDGAASGAQPWARLSYDDSRDGISGGAGVRGGSGGVDYAAGLWSVQHDDYTSAGGIGVPAGQREDSAFASFGFRPGDTQRLAIAVLARDGGETDFPSLPMDSDRDRDRLYTATWSLRPEGGGGGPALVEAHAGYAPIDHWMSNRRKSTWTTMQSESVSQSATRSAGARATWSLGSGGSLSAGGDFTGVDRDALRTRTMTMTGMTATDHLWPDASQDVGGLFVEYTRSPARGWWLRAGLRHDRADSAAGATDDAALGGLTVREAYVQYYGTEAGATDRSERLWSGNVLLAKDLDARWSFEGGLGMTSRAAGVTERYFAYAPSPGGYLCGNPALEAEVKREASVGLVFSGATVSAGATLYHYDFQDYINSLVLARQDVNDDGVVDIVRGFENVRAVLDGLEATLVLRPSARLTLPLAIAWVRAENRDSGSPLAEIPPLEGRMAARFRVERSGGGKNTGAGGRPDARESAGAGEIEIGARLVASQDRIDPAFGEDTTPGYAVWHLRGEWTIAGRLRLAVGIENLFDKEYHEHLTREAAVPDGDLAAGDEIPQPGRTLVVALRADF